MSLMPSPSSPRSIPQWLLLLALSFLLLACSPETSLPPSTDKYQDLLANQFGDYAHANRTTALVFPRDHGSHPDFRMEWWYITANLADSQGNWYGVQWTLFRSGLNGPKTLGEQRQVYMAHAAFSWQGGHHAMQKYARGGTGQAGVEAKPFSAWIDQWQLQSSTQSWLPLTLSASDDDHHMNLTLNSSKPLVLQGDNGFSVKNNQGSGSYYYSQPYLQVNGQLTIQGQRIEVTGQAWLDREWSSQFLLPNQQGWDWFALHLDSGEKIMVYQLRQQDSNQPPQRWLSWFDNAAKRQLYTDDFELKPISTSSVARRDIPTQWQLNHPDSGLAITVTARQAEQWMELDYPYWEGPVTFTGSHSGIGYLEMTGY